VVTHEFSRLGPGEAMSYRGSKSRNARAAGREARRYIVTKMR